MASPKPARGTMVATMTRVLVGKSPPRSFEKNTARRSTGAARSRSKSRERYRAARATVKLTTIASVRPPLRIVDATASARRGSLLSSMMATVMK